MKTYKLTESDQVGLLPSSLDLDAEKRVARLLNVNRSSREGSLLTRVALKLHACLGVLNVAGVSGADCG